jgi:tetratricopeptide (TPR) repeat protein
MQSDETGFVGRPGPLAVLRARLDDAGRGRGALVLVTGEPGIGKTSLVRRLAATLDGGTPRVLWGGGGGEGGPTLWPWAQALRELTLGLDLARLVAESGTDAAEVARLVPDLLPAPAGAAPRARDGADADAVRCGAAVAGLLRHAAARQPLVLILDDLHRADPASVRVLRLIARDLGSTRLLVVGTYSDTGLPAGHPLTAFLGESTGGWEVIALGGLTVDEVGRLLAQATATAPAPEVVAAVYHVTNGNPSFLRRLVPSLTAGGTLGSGSAGARQPPEVPAPVREVVRHRLARLSTATQDLLSVAAVIGHEFPLTVLAHVIGQSPVQGLEAIEEAVVAGLVVEIPETSTRFRFAHPLVWAAVYPGLGRARRAMLHGRVGEALEAQFADDPGSHLAELAHHFLRALPGGDPAKARDYARRAGERALRDQAPGPAAEYFKRALEVSEEWEPGNRQIRRDLLLALGRARMAQGHVAEARAAFHGLVTLAHEIGDRQFLAPAALRRAALGDEAVVLARQLGDEATLAAVLLDHHAAKYASPNADERLAIAAEVVRLAERRGDKPLALRARAALLGDLAELGDAAGLASELDAYEAAAEQVHPWRYLWPVIALRAGTAILACRFDEGKRLCDGLASSQRARLRNVDLALRGLVLFVQGRCAEYEPAMREFVERHPATPWRCCLALALATGKRLEEARAELRDLVDHNFGRVPRNADWLPVLALLALTAAVLGDIPAAAAVYRELAPYARSCVRVGRFGIGLGSTAYFLGVLALTLGRRDEAAYHFERAVAVNQRIGAVGPLENSRYQYGAALLARGRAEDQAAAHAHMRQALETAEQLGIALLLTEPTGGDEGRRGRPAAPPPPLFRQEGEYWAIAYRAGMFRMRTTVGLVYLAHLLTQPHQAIAAVVLTGLGRWLPPPLRTVEGPVATSTGDAGEMLDGRAEQAYRRRLEDLNEELREAESWNDRERTAKAQEEMAAIADHLARALGLKGRRRVAASHAERARVNATKAIKATIRRIARYDRALAEHLGRSIRTGNFCVYAPAPD